MQVVSIYPKVTAQMELSVVPALNGPFKNLSVLNGLEAFTASWVSATGSGVDLDFGKDREKTVLQSLEKIKATQTVDNIKYSLDFGVDGTLNIMLEAGIPLKKTVEGTEVTTYVYQRLHVTVYPNRLGYSTLLIPVMVNNALEVDTNEDKYVGLVPFISLALIAGTLLLGAAGGAGFAAKGIHILKWLRLAV